MPKHSVFLSTGFSWERAKGIRLWCGFQVNHSNVILTTTRSNVSQVFYWYFRFHSRSFYGQLLWNCGNFDTSAPSKHKRSWPLKGKRYSVSARGSLLHYNLGNHKAEGTPFLCYWCRQTNGFWVMCQFETSALNDPNRHWKVLHIHFTGVPSCQIALPFCCTTNRFRATSYHERSALNDSVMILDKSWSIYVLFIVSKISLFRSLVIHFWLLDRTYVLSTIRPHANF